MDTDLPLSDYDLVKAFNRKASNMWHIVSEVRVIDNIVLQA